MFFSRKKMIVPEGRLSRMGALSPGWESGSYFSAFENKKGEEGPYTKKHSGGLDYSRGWSGIAPFFDYEDCRAERKIQKIYSCLNSYHFNFHEFAPGGPRRSAGFPSRTVMAVELELLKWL